MTRFLPSAAVAFAIRNAFATNDFHSRGRLCYTGEAERPREDSWTVADNADTARFETMYTQGGNDEFKSMDYELDYRSGGGRQRSVPFSAASAPAPSPKQLWRVGDSAAKDVVLRNESKRSQADSADRDATRRPNAGRTTSNEQRSTDTPLLAGGRVVHL
jgi:hypothetical protein